MKNILILLSALILVALFLPFYLAGALISFGIGAFNGGLGVRSSYLQWVNSK